jgi:TetR/AcrR family transcriptional regulator, fatty acid metabolism regulator protein
MARRQVNRLPPERRVADILLAAKLVFLDRGYNEALISDIAERAGVVEGSIYRFFQNKRDLMIKMVEHWYEDLLAHDEPQLQGVRGTWNRIRFMVHHHLATIRREPALSRLVFQELRPDPEYRNMRLFQLNQAYTHRIVDIVKAAMASGEFRSDVPASLVRDMIYGAVEHRTWAFLRNEGDFNTEETADGITELIYRGLANSAKAEPLAKATLRLEAVAERLEALTKTAPAAGPANEGGVESAHLTRLDRRHRPGRGPVGAR